MKESIFALYKKGWQGDTSGLSKEQTTRLGDLTSDGTPLKEALSYMVAIAEPMQVLVINLCKLGELIAVDPWEDGYPSLEKHREVVGGILVEAKAYFDACYLKTPGAEEAIEKLAARLKNL